MTYPIWFHKGWTQDLTFFGDFQNPHFHHRQVVTAHVAISGSVTLDSPSAAAVFLLSPVLSSAWKCAVLFGSEFLLGKSRKMKNKKNMRNLLNPGNYTIIKIIFELILILRQILVRKLMEIALAFWQPEDGDPFKRENLSSCCLAAPNRSPKEVARQLKHNKCMYVCTYVRMYVCMHGWMDGCTYVRTYVGM